MCLSFAKSNKFDLANDIFLNEAIMKNLKRKSIRSFAKSNKFDLAKTLFKRGHYEKLKKKVYKVVKNAV